MEHIRPAPGSLSIELENHFKAKVYSTSSAVCGQVIINCKKDVLFDDLSISLAGRTTTAIRGHASNRMLKTSYPFLELPMPLAPGFYPMSRILKAGQSYTVPFYFVIPEHLTLDACPHTANCSAHDAHTQLPPSMGTWERDSFSTKKATVSYAIVAKVSRKDQFNGPKKTILENSKEILVLPTSLDEPPLDIRSSDKMYRLTKSKTLRPSLLSKGMGNITVTAFQPAAIMLENSGHEASNTQIQLNLKFAPGFSKIEFPKITKLSTRIKSVTIFGFKGFSDLPNLGDWTDAAVNSNWRCNTISIPHQVLEETSWQQGLSQSKNWYNEIDDSSSDHSINEKMGDIESFGEGATYHSRTRLEIGLPVDEEVFLPTFHNCIISRIYVLLLSATLSAGGISSTINLRVPLQIGVRSSDEEMIPEYKY